MALKQTFIPVEVLNSYGLADRETVVVPLGKGNINDTYLVSFSSGKVVFQRINAAVFPAPAAIAANFQFVSGHIQKQIRTAPFEYQCAELIPTLEGEGWYIDQKGECWRAQNYIEHAVPESRHLNYGSAVQLGQVLARFHLLTEGLDVTELHEPIPGFHRTLRYLESFDTALAEAQPADSAALSACRAYVERFRKRVTVLERERASGRLPIRVMHGDPKLDNVIWRESEQAKGLFDLDTVGPGLRLYDLGDCLRSSCNLIGEEACQHEVTFSAEIFQAVLEGYFSAGDNFLGANERELIVDAALTITVELGVRFLTDYISGNVYFKTTRDGQNLERALVQFKLADSMESQEKELRRMIA
ncbi:phosphotransferase enzyme family protein [Desulfosediminicola ganghwensis]|uniref:phosphotransferase enzyme family protein n=1 Tax=Desulfosediminicola ganghwensis TaxID=2569540 RepID=UPI0010ABE3F0|nr:aminoglycoside phosphotransferase family protein [Desulfosediminicola ganghwensis]